MLNVGQALGVIETFLADAGSLAMQARGTAKGFAKADSTLVTETDLAISKLAHQRLSAYLEQPEHVLIDEESIAEIGTPAEVFAKSEYQWVLDPIDGTVPYASGLDNFGVMLGLFHKGSPLAAGLYLPARNVFLLADDAQVYQVENGTRRVLQQPAEPEAGPRSMIQLSGLGWEAGYLRTRHYAWFVIGDSAAGQFSTTILGQMAGMCGHGRLGFWDVAAGAIIAHRLGMQLKWNDTQAPMMPFTADDFKENWKVARPFAGAYGDNNLKLISNMLTEAQQFVKEKNL